MHLISCTILLLFTQSPHSINGEYSGYSYGDSIADYRWEQGTVLAQYTSISNAEQCSDKCTNWSGGDCENWAFNPSISSGKCVIGKEAEILSASGWTAGLNNDVCDDALDCSQNSVCDSWSNEDFDILGGQRTLITDGNTRCYYAYVPSSCEDNSGSPCKIIFNFGGVQRNAIPWANERIAFTERITGWTTPGIVIYPQRFAQTGGWQYLPGRAGMCTTGITTDDHYDDTKFVNDILSDLQNNNNIYYSNVYAMGHGNGGHFAMDLASRLKDEFNIPVKAIGTYSGNSLTDHGGTIEAPSTAVNVLIVQGYNDNQHDYWGHKTTGCDMGKDDSQALANWWASASNCDASPVIDECWSGSPQSCTGTDGEKERHYTNCDNGVDIILKSTKTEYSFSSAGDTIFPDFFRDH